MKKSEGDCYESSYRYLMHTKNGKLIHAIAVGRGVIEGKLMGHAWVEYDIELPNEQNIRMAYDAATQQSFLAEEVRKAGQVQYAVEYTGDEAISKALTHGTYGPWDEEISQVLHRGLTPRRT